MLCHCVGKSCKELAVSKLVWAHQACTTLRCTVDAFSMCLQVIRSLFCTDSCSQQIPKGLASLHEEVGYVRGLATYS